MRALIDWVLSLLQKWSARSREKLEAEQKAVEIAVAERERIDEEVKDMTEEEALAELRRDYPPRS